MKEAARTRSVGVRPSGRSRRLIVLVAALSTALSVAASAEPRATPSREASDDPDGVMKVRSVSGSRDGRSAAPGSGPGLDDLLRLPSDFQSQAPSRSVAGPSEQEWRNRFERAQTAIADARKKLVETKQELDGLAENGGANQWSVAPPGGGGGAQQTTSPLSFKLREELRRNREALTQAQRGLRELKIEADLAGVPAGWRVVAAQPAKTGATAN